MRKRAKQTSPKNDCGCWFFSSSNIKHLFSNRYFHVIQYSNEAKDILVKGLPSTSSLLFCLCPDLIPWSRKRHPTPVFLPGSSHGQRSLVGYSSWGRKVWDTTERLSTRARHHFPGMHTEVDTINWISSYSLSLYLYFSLLCLFLLERKLVFLLFNQRPPNI